MKEIRSRFKTVTASWVVALFLTILSGCGGGSAELIAAAVNLTGSWDVSELITTASGICSYRVDDPPDTWSADVVQSGNNVTVTITSGDNVGTEFTGTISGDKINWKGSYPTSGGTTTVKETDVTATDTSFTGTANWDWTDGTDSCSGTTKLTGYKS